LPVSRREALRPGRVEKREPFAKPDAAEQPMELASLLPNSLGDFGNGCEAILDGSEVKAGAADKNGQPSGPGRDRDLIQRQCSPGGDRAAFGGIEKPIELMRRSLFGGRRGTCGQNSKIAIELLAIGIDDGSA